MLWVLNGRGLAAASGPRVRPIGAARPPSPSRARLRATYVRLCTQSSRVQTPPFSNIAPVATPCSGLRLRNLCLVLVLLRERDVGNHGGLRITTECRLQNASEHRLTVRHVDRVSRGGGGGGGGSSLLLLLLLLTG